MSKAEDRALEAYPSTSHYWNAETDRNAEAREFYIQGYHQAEKDLDVVSCVKEVSGVKELSRAEEESLKAYPPQSIAANYDTINRRDAFEYGYLKAEKDLELTWKDLALIRLAFDATEDNINHGCLKISPMTKEYYEEVLKRFKAHKIEIEEV